MINDYKFTARWKEELICNGPMGEFTLFFPMGTPTVIAPTKDVWNAKFKECNYDYFKAQIINWCGDNNVQIQFSDDAYIW